MNLQELLESISAIARNAGAAILDVYQRADHGVRFKDDASPLTHADLAAHDIINAALSRLTPQLPVLSEESAGIPWSVRREWTRYWLVDPLDGTKEFINRNGEFTVNIALVEHGVPVLGVVFAPVQNVLYGGAAQIGAWKEQAGQRERIRTVSINEGQGKLRVVASRRHAGEELEAWLARLQQRFPDLELLSMGSSLKICLVAEGRADIYPRLAPTCEWDTAAAQAVLEAAGGLLTDTKFTPYRYNAKEALLNPHFLALGDAGFRP
ncbi:MAG: 3'(2'),5'-bisphosphate nucleotidase CysQ [Pseudomonadota bacterium]|nr:3'(2'),5'-bisphosphate nucleotidase CysQ [Pseudomonadota bacterium]